MKKRNSFFNFHSELGKPSTLNVAKAVGWVTFLEIIRDKVLYNVLVCSSLLFGLGFLASRVSVIRPERIVLNFGLSAVAISCGAIAVLMGSTLLIKEFERRTIYVALAHPISRAQFAFGKFIGLVLVVTVNWVLLVGAYFVLLGLAADSFKEVFSSTLLIALYYIWLQSLLFAAISLFFSTFSTASLAVIFSIGLYLVGSNASQIRLIASQISSSGGKLFLNSIATVLPNFEFFNLGTQVLYGLPISFMSVLASSVYGVFTIAIFLIIAGLLIQGREV